MCNRWGEAAVDVRDELTLTAIALLDGGNTNVQGVLEQLLATNADAFVGNLVAHMAEISTTVEALPSTKLDGTHTPSAANPVDEVLSVDGTTVAGTANAAFEAQVEEAFAAGLPEPRWESATNLFRLIQVMVEGHHFNLQTLLREFTTTRGIEVRSRTAAGKGKSANSRVGAQGAGVVASACEFLETLAPRLCSVGAADLAAQVLDTLVELVQGPCHENQVTLINNRVGHGSELWVLCRLH